MTPEELQTTLDIALPDMELPSVEFPGALVRAMEQYLDSEGPKPALWTLMGAVHNRLQCTEGIPAVIGLCRIEQLVRWDDWSVTFDGSHTQTGEMLRIRTLRRHVKSEPWYRRQLFREGNALISAGLAPKLERQTGPWPALIHPLDGPPLEEGAPVSGHTERAIWSIRLWGTALQDLITWEQSGFTLPRLSYRDLRLNEAGLGIVCLSPSGNPRQTPNLDLVASAILNTYGEDVAESIEPLLQGLIDFPDSSPTDIAERLIRSLSSTLADLRHGFVLDQHQATRENRLERLRHWLKRLANNQRPPAGNGALGVNLDGHTTVVSGQGQSLLWGVSDQRSATIWSEQEGLTVREARRMLRSHSVAPHNARLNRQIGGDPAYVDHVCRWLNAALQMRTLLMLTEKQSHSS